MKAVISKDGKSFQREIDLNLVYGKKIGEKVDGTSIGLEGYELQVTGGSDKQGFPMRKGVAGAVRKRLLLSSGAGYKPERKGVRKRKGVRGEVISEEIAQLNLKVLKEGKKKFDEFFKKEEGTGEKQEEKEKPEEIKEDKKEEKAETNKEEPKETKEEKK